VAGLSIDRGGARHPLIELSLGRLREFAREPEAVFWSFIFPILMSVTMALAFPGAQSLPIHAAPSAAVLAFALGLSLVTGIFFGVAPAWIAANAF